VPPSVALLLLPSQAASEPVINTIAAKNLKAFIAVWFFLGLLILTGW
jgi:hypothetical protein